MERRCDSDKTVIIKNSIVWFAGGSVSACGLYGHDRNNNDYRDKNAAAER